MVINLVCNFFLSVLDVRLRKLAGEKEELLSQVRLSDWKVMLMNLLNHMVNCY